MEKKLFSFSMTFDFIADNKEEAIKMMQENLDDWEESITNAGNWVVMEEIVEVSG